jgi:tRNA G18 (ribose-2'-O)-methylase SpoU
VAADHGVLDTPDDPLRLARKAETVLQGRTEQVVLVLEHCTDDFNHVAVLRTCEAMGLQHVWLIKAPLQREHAVLIRNSVTTVYQQCNRSVQIV